MHPLVQVFEQNIRKQHSLEIPDFQAGDTLNVSINIKEGSKERTQKFQGVVIQRKNRGRVGETFTLRKISAGIGVLRTFPILSPFITKIERIRRGKVRRARLYYLIGKQGRAAKVKEKI